MDQSGSSGSDGGRVSPVLVADCCVVGPSPVVGVHQVVESYVDVAGVSIVSIMQCYTKGTSQNKRKMKVSQS